MKKFSSLAISVCLLIASLSAVLVVPSSAASTGTTYFETPANWTYYKNGTTIGDSVVSDKTPRAETGAAYVREGGSSLYMNAHGYVPAIKLPNLELNKTYTLSFWYLAPAGSTATSIKAWLTTPGVYKSGEHSVGNNAAIDGTASAVALGANAAGAGNLVSGTAGDDTFYQYTISFTTTEETGTDLYFAWRQWVIGFGTIYVDDFRLTEQREWKGFTNASSNNTTYFGENGTPYSNTTITVTNEQNYTGKGNDGDPYSYKISGSYAHYAATKVQFEKNKYYNLTFYYYGTALDSSNGMFSDIKLAKEGAVTNDDASTNNLSYLGRSNGYYTRPSGLKIPVAGRVTSGVLTSQWNKVTLPFYSGDNDYAWFAVRPTASTTAIVYIDNIVLEETTAPTDLDYSACFETYYNWNMMDGTSYDIPADTDDWVQKGSSWGSVTQSTSANTYYTPIGGTAKNTKSIKYSGQNHPIFIPLDGLKEHSNYTLSFYYKASAVSDWNGNDYLIAGSGIYTTSLTLPEGETRVPGTAETSDGYLLYRGRNTGYTNTDGNYSSGNRKYNGDLMSVGAVANEWNYIEYTFNTDTYKDLYFVLYCVAAGASHTVYFDEFELTLNSTDETVLQTAYNSKAAIRSGEKTDGSIASNGLRTYNAIKSDWVDAADSSIIEFGSIAIREGYMEKKFPTKSAPDLDMLSLVGKGVGIGVSYRSAATVTGSDTITSTLWENNNTDGVFATDIFTAYLTGIDAANYGEEYLVRAYAIDASGNIYYGDTASVSIFKVAQAISAENDASKTIDQDAFKAFVGGQTTAYETWCTDNGLAVGDLYTALYAG